MSFLEKFKKFELTKEQKKSSLGELGHCVPLITYEIVETHTCDNEVLDGGFIHFSPCVKTTVLVPVYGEVC
jgi:hypothetical protein